MVTEYIEDKQFTSKIVIQNIRGCLGVRIFKSEFRGPASFDYFTRIGPHVRMGRYCSTGENVVIVRAYVGSFCAFGNGVAVNPFNHPTDWLSTHDFQYRDDSYDWVPEYREMERLSRTPDMLLRVAIGNDVWVGHGAVITSSVTIGDGAIIAAGAVVTKDVQPYAIVGGVPAKFIRWRFPLHIIDRLLAVKWWDLPLEKLSGLPFRDIEQCLDILERHRAVNAGQQAMNAYRNGYERAVHEKIAEERSKTVAWLSPEKEIVWRHPEWRPTEEGWLRGNFMPPPIPDQMLTEQGF